VLPEKEQINALKKFSCLLSAGIPAAKAMEFSGFPVDAVEAVTKGRLLSEAIRPFFSSKTADFIRIGEAGGDLASSADAAYRSMHSSREQKNALIKALAYPAFVLFFGLICIFFFAWHIVPQLRSVFESMNIEPSPALAFMEFFAAVSAFSLSALAAAILLMRSLHRHRTFRRLAEEIQLRIPVIGEVFKKAGTCRAVSDISVLIGTGLPMTEALASVAYCTDSVLFEESLLRIRSSVENGAKLSQAFSDQPLFGELISRMALIGEETGDLSASLGSAADITSGELGESVKLLAQAAEPAATVAVGVFAAMLVFSMLSPITCIMDKLQ